ncbi:TPA: AlpA family transcriptional regulator [Escherichia coli]|nr:AlpA family transcriptional regulator [Escherichia coli]
MNNPSTVRILRLPAVIQKTGMARATIYDWLNSKSPRYDSTFPKKRMLGVKSVGWVEAEIDEWLTRRSKLI